MNSKGRAGTEQGCSGLPGVGQMPSRTVQGCTFISGVGHTRGRAVAQENCTGLYN